MNKNILKQIESVYKIVAETTEEIRNGDMNSIESGEYFNDVMADKILELLETLKYDAFNHKVIRAKIWCKDCNMYYKPLSINHNKSEMLMICPVCSNSVVMDAPIETIKQFEVN